jgi:hypothetical protein
LVIDGPAMPWTYAVWDARGALAAIGWATSWRRAYGRAVGLSEPHHVRALLKGPLEGDRIELNRREIGGDWESAQIGHGGS